MPEDIHELKTIFRNLERCTKIKLAFQSEIVVFQLENLRAKFDTFYNCLKGKVKCNHEKLDQTFQYFYHSLMTQ